MNFENCLFLLAQLQDKSGLEGPLLLPAEPAALYPTAEGLDQNIYLR